MEKLYCTKCGKENSLEGARFCAFCGGELGGSALPADRQLSGLCAELKNTYINYINWTSDYLSSRSAGKILAGMFTSNADFNNRDEHNVFVAECERLSAGICSAASGCDSSAELMKLLDYVLFDVYSHCGDEAGWMLLACEKYCIPMLELLSAADLAQLYERYKAFRKKKMNLPVQDEMLKTMKKLSKGR